MEEKAPTEAQKKEISDIRNKYGRIRDLIAGISMASLLTGGVIAFSSINFSEKLNPYSDMSVVGEYNEIQRREFDIGRDIDYLKREIENTGNVLQLSYQPEELKQSIENTFADTHKINSLERLTQRYQSHLEQTNERLEELRENPEVKKYLSSDKKILYMGGGGLIWSVLSGIGGLISMSLSDRIRNRKIKEIKNRN